MFELNVHSKLKLNFYKEPTLKVAQNLLGKVLIRVISEIPLAGIIVETEAYLSQNDEASHSFNGKSKRNNTMFNSCGYLYVYQIYGIHYCCNVVTGKENVGEAVLIRAIEPILNKEIMHKNRFNNNNFIPEKLISLSNGPAKLCKSLAITKDDDGTNLLGNDIYIVEGNTIPKGKIVITNRIGINKSKELPFRFYIEDNKFISNK